MYKSILHFCENGTGKMDHLSADFFENPTDIAAFVSGVQNVVVKLGCDFLGEVFQEMDDMLRQSARRKEKWHIVRRDPKTLLTSLGTIHFRKTLFKHKKTGERAYLVDRILGLEENERMTEDAEAKLLEEAVDGSYRKAGMLTSISDSVSKSTVMNKLHALEFPKEVKIPETKKQVKYLYIDADEDHVPLQFFETKGDIVPDEKGRKYNGTLAKLIYVYEGIEATTPNGGRYRLINPHYFSGIYEGKNNEALWDEVYQYLEETYDLDHVEKIYLNADGGSWIQGVKSKVHGIVSVLDEYHLNKYLVSMTTVLHDSAGDERDELKKIIRSGTKETFKERTREIAEYTESESAKARIEKGRDYILSNWSAAKTRLQKKDGVIGSSTEGHVSHVLSSRMSSRPMGWSKHGANQMAHLRAYSWNKGDMLELVRYQKRARKENPLREELSAAVMLQWEKTHRKKDGKYYDAVQYSLANQARKILAIGNRVSI